MNLKTPRPKFKGKNAFIKSLSCAAAGMHNIQCCEGLDECHYRVGTHGMNCKNDEMTWPGCRFHHQYQHHKGEKSFWGDKPIAVLCQDLHDAYKADNRANAMMAIACFIQFPMVRE